MKLFFDFFPILLFFIAYKLGDIYIATGVAILACFLQVIYSRIKLGYFEKLPIFTLLIMVILGGATLLFRNEIFIKWKPTALYWLLAIVFFSSQFIGDKPIIQRLAERGISLTPTIWHKINFSWVLFFALMGILNLYVVHHFDTDTWVNFKLFGTLILTFLFVIIQTLYMVRQSKKLP